MRSSILIAGAGLLVSVLLAVGAVYAYDHSREDRIADGITVGGIDVGGLSRERAASRVRRTLLDRQRGPIVVHYGSRMWQLDPREARVAIDVSDAIDQAVFRSREGNVISRTVREITGAPVDATFSPRVRYSKPAVASFVNRIDKAIDRRPRDATLKFTATTVSRIPGRDGRVLQTRALLRRIDAAVTTPRAPRELVAVARRAAAKVSTSDLARTNETVLIVDRAGFTLRLFKNLKLVKSYPIAVGRQGLETPSGTYTINDKQINPSWHVPNSSWAGDLAGKVIPPGPDDPLKARWLGFYNGAGIHGTADDSSIGTAASHGCIRMHIPDVVDLYPRVPLGSTIYVA